MSHSGAITEGISFVEADELADRLQKGDGGKFVVIDVREPEEIARDGSIAGKINIPSSIIKDVDRAKSIVLDHKDKEEIVVHCLKSQHRGPLSALALSGALEQLQQSGEVDKLPFIKVLRGGFQEFNSKFADTEMVEK